jgi:hypothetical protein
MSIRSWALAYARTILIISSDHSWRVDYWRNSPFWNEEEEQASGRKFDPRPVLLIQFPGNQVGELHREPFPELETSGVIRAMLRNELISRATLDAWLVNNHTEDNRSLGQ